MTGAEWCLFGAVLLYLLTIAPFKALGHRDFNNAAPRDAGFYQTPLRSRALGAHINGIETFPYFAAAVLLSEFRHCPQGTINALAAAFLGIRLCFIFAYLANRPTLRTILWNIGFAINTAIFLLAAFR